MPSTVEMSPKLLSRPLTGTLEEKEEEEAAPLVLLHNLEGFLGGTQPCTLFFSSPSRKSTVSNTSCQGEGLAKLMLTKKWLWLQHGNGIWNQPYRSYSGLQ